MADKSFGVKDINLIGASGVPTIDSPNNLNINAINVAISTDITVAGKVSLGAGTSISSPGSNILTFGTNSTESSYNFWWQYWYWYDNIDSSGNAHLSITNGSNLVFSTSGTGIDFSATSDGGTSTPSELLDDYEEGSWDPQILGWNGSYSTQEGRYIKIGRMVHVIGEVKTAANAGNSFTNAWPGLSNLPFVNTTSFQGVSGSQRCMGYGTIIGDVSPGGTNGQAFVTFDRNTGNNAFFPNHISSQGAQNFQNTMINNPTTADFGYRYNCTYYTD